VKLFDAAVLLFGTALGLYLIHYSVYAANGIGVPGFMVAGDGTRSLAQLLSSSLSTVTDLIAGLRSAGYVHDLDVHRRVAAGGQGCGAR